MDDTARGLANLDLLTTPAGRALLDRLGEHARDGNGDRDELWLATALRREHPADLVTAALAQHGLRRRAAAKFDRAERMFFTRDGLEQASAEPVARHRAARFAAARPGAIADLCCGIGGDLLALAGTGARVFAVDRDELHLRMAALNAAAYGVADRVQAVGGDVREADLAGVRAAFVDPARRAAGHRLRTGDSEPPLDWCLALAGAGRVVAIKAAPGLDRAAVPDGWEVEFVADGRELKEAVLWSPALAAAPSRATVLSAGPAGAGARPGSAGAGARAVDQLLPEPGEPVACREPGGYLLDPNPAVTRAGLVEDLARRVGGAWKIDPRIAFLASDRPIRTPFGRPLRVLDDGPWKERELAGRLRALDIGALDIRRRGLAGDVPALHRRLRGRGARAGVLVMTRVRDRPWALICVPDETADSC